MSESRGFLHVVEPVEGRASRDGALVAVVMGSKTDWEVMIHTTEVLEALHIGCEVRVLSAFSSPELVLEFASQAEGRGVEVVIAGAEGASMLPGLLATRTLLPVLGVPIAGRVLSGLDSLLSIVQVPTYTPLATVAIGKEGAINAALFAASILGTRHPIIRESLRSYRETHGGAGLRETF